MPARSKSGAVLSTGIAQTGIARTGIAPIIPNSLSVAVMAIGSLFTLATVASAQSTAPMPDRPAISGPSVTEGTASGGVVGPSTTASDPGAGGLSSSTTATGGSQIAPGGRAGTFSGGGMTTSGTGGAGMAGSTMGGIAGASKGAVGGPGPVSGGTGDGIGAR